MGITRYDRLAQTTNIGARINESTESLHGPDDLKGLHPSRSGLGRDQVHQPQHHHPLELLFAGLGDERCNVINMQTRSEIMAIDNSTGKDKEFYDLGKKMFDRIQPITRGVPQTPQERYSKRPWVGLTDREILADDVLRYHFGLNGGGGPVSKSGRKIVDAIETKLKELNHGK